MVFEKWKNHSSVFFGGGLLFTMHWLDMLL